MRRMLVLGIAAAGVIGWSTGVRARPAERVVDLTHAFDETTIYWPTEDGFRLETRFRGHTEHGYFYAANRFCAPEHGGTHLDAPLHFYEGGASAEAIPVERLVGPGVVVDVTRASAANPTHAIGIADLEAHERRHGRIPRGAIVLLHTGFGAFWPDRARYLGTGERGPAAVAKLRFPGLDPAAAAWIATERSIDAIGIDTASIDPGTSTTFASHVRLFEKGIPAFENVASLERLPAEGFTIVALPMKIRGGSGGPLRIVALLGR